MSTKSLQRMATPLMVSFTLRFLFTFVDLAYAAVLGEDAAAVAAIGFYAPLQSIYIAIWVGLSAGFPACLSKAFGHRDDVRIRQLKRSMLRLLAVLVPVLLAPIAFRRNVLTKGASLQELIGKSFSIQGVEFSGVEEAAPCYWMNEACAEGVHDYLKGKGGLRARITKGGELKRGSSSLTLLP